MNVDKRGITLYSAVDEDLQVETSCIILLIIATCVALEQFCCRKY